MDNQIEKEEIVKNVTMTAIEANLYGVLLFIPVFIIFGLPYIGLWGWDSLKEGGNLFLHNKLYFVTTILLGIIVHEALHGLTWAKYCKNGIKSIKFGVKWKYLTPYAHCKEPLTVSHYKIGGAMPGIVLGIIPSIIALLTGSAWLMCFGLFFTGAAGGDMLVLWNLRGYDNNYLMKDHPDEIGFMVIKNNLNRNENKNEA